MADEADSISTPPSNASPVTPGTHDKHGTPFDPAKHIPRMHPKTGRWMPRSGGRKPKSASASSFSTSSQPAPTAPAASANSLPSPPDSLVAPEIVPASAIVGEGVPTATVPPPASTEKTDAPPPAPGASFIPASPPPATDTEPAGKTTGKAVETLEVVEAADDIAEIIANAFYNLAGFIFDAPDEWGLSGHEHSRTVKGIAAYVRTRGGTITPGKALVILAAAYVLRGLAKPKSKAKAKVWTDKLRAHLFAKKSAPVVAPAEPAKAPPPAAVAPSASEPVPFFNL